jgi:hypothetical protein
MRRRRAERPHMLRSVDGVTCVGKEDRVRHRCVIPFLRIVLGFHPGRTKRPRRRRISRSSGGHRPHVNSRIVEDGHPLVRAVYRNDKIRSRRSVYCQDENDCYKYDSEHGLLARLRRAIVR